MKYIQVAIFNFSDISQVCKLRNLLLTILYQHSAAVIGRKMVVVGGDSDYGMLNDVQVF